VSFACRRCFFTGASILAPNRRDGTRAHTNFLKLKCDSCTHGKHSPHSEANAFQECNAIAEEFLQVSDDSATQHGRRPSEIEAVAENHFGN